MNATALRVQTRVRLHRDLPPPQLRRALREAAGLSQQELADAVDCSRAAIGYYETGARTPRGDLLVRYVAALKALQADPAEVPDVA